MNILFLTVTDQRAHSMGRYVDLHCTYDFQNWIIGFSAVLPRIQIYDYYKSFVELGPYATEKKIVEIITESSIDLLIVPNIYYEINVSFIKSLQKRGVKTALVFFDDLMRFDDTNRYYFGYCDYVITHESARALNQYGIYGIEADFFPNLPSVTYYDQLLSVGVGALNDLKDISFVGANIADRFEFISALELANLPVSVYGVGWLNGRVTQSEMLHIFRESKISLNFTKSLVKNGKQLKGRAFEIVMAGGFLLTEFDEELLSYFEVGREIDVFTTPEECVEKVKYYLENSALREEMRRLAVAKCRDLLSFERSWELYLQKISDDIHHSSTITLGSQELPEKALQSFVRWNLSYVHGRLRTLQPKLALDQVLWAFRDIQLFANMNAVAVLGLVVKEIVIAPIRAIKCRASKFILLRGLNKRFLKASAL